MSEEISIWAYSLDEAIRNLRKHELKKGPYYDQETREAELLTIRISANENLEFVFRVEPWKTNK